MNKLGLVFAGGGGKGGYEIGVWKYLHSIGLDKYISVVSGTSVGALNSVLFAYGNLELAENIWCNQIKDKILAPYDINQYIKLLDNEGKNFIPAVISIFQKVASSGLFTREGLEKIINDNIDVHQISESERSLYAVCSYIPDVTDNSLINLIPAMQDDNKAEYFKLNGRLSSEIISILLASSAIPGVFNSIKIEGKEYYDGGLKDNIPVKPLSMEGCSHAIIVYLNHEGVSNPVWKSHIPNIIEVRPSEDLGNFIKGTLDFSPEGTRKRIKLGETDGENLKNQFEQFLKDFHSENEIPDSIERTDSFENNISKTNNVICTRCKNKFRIDGLPGKMYEVIKSDYSCSECGNNNLMKISLF